MRTFPFAKNLKVNFNNLSLIFSPKISEKVKFEVNFNGEYERLYSIVIGRTGIIHSEVNYMEQNADKKMSFEFMATNLMAPSANVIVYYIQRSGEIVYDQFKIDFEASKENYVSIFE